MQSKSEWTLCAALTKISSESLLSFILYQMDLTGMLCHAELKVSNKQKCSWKISSDLQTTYSWVNIVPYWWFHSPLMSKDIPRSTLIRHKNPIEDCKKYICFICDHKTLVHLLHSMWGCNDIKTLGSPRKQTYAEESKKNTDSTEPKLNTPLF